MRRNKNPPIWAGFEVRGTVGLIGGRFLEERGNAGDYDLLLVGPQAESVEPLPIRVFMVIGEEFFETPKVPARTPTRVMPI